MTIQLISHPFFSNYQAPMMPEKTLETLHKAVTDFQAVKESFEQILDSANKEFDAIPVDLQDEDEASELEDYISDLDDSIDSLDDIIDEMDDVIEHMEDVLREESFLRKK